MWDIDQQVKAQKQVNQRTQARNAVLDAEVRDLKQGTEAIEERARNELGMIKRDEVFFQIVGGYPASAPLAVPAAHGINSTEKNNPSGKRTAN